MKAEICSPLKEKTYTCYTSESLARLKKLWNTRHPDVPINAKHDKEIWKALKKNMSKVCDSERCWMRQGFAKHGLTNEMQYYTFAPDAPKTWRKNINEWLSSVDIENVMKQYEEKYPTFGFFGPTPIDFDSRKLYGECVWEELCHFNLMDQLKKNKKKIGIIFNLDEHWNEGSHWVSLFLDIPSRKICYFDSAGDDIPPEIQTLIERIIHQGKMLDIQFKCEKNHPFRHQMKDTECGVYCLYFIINMIKNPSFTKFQKERIRDEHIEKYRRIYFTI